MPGHVLRRNRFCATYVPLPFTLSTALADFGNVIVPPIARGRDAERPPVTLRFHETAPAPVDLNLAAVHQAVRDARHPDRALTAVSMQLDDLRLRATAERPVRLGVAELVTEIPPVVITPDVSTELLEYCLRALNRFLDVYLVATEDSAVHPVTIEHLGPEVVIGLRTTRLGDNRELLLPNRTMPMRGEQSERPDHLLALLPRLLRAEPHQHPIDLVRRLKLRADRLADQGEHEAAVIVLQSSAERLVHALHFLARVDAGADRQRAEEMVDAPFKRTLLQLADHIGGNWSLAGGGPVACYWRDVYELRGRLIHGGRPVDRDAVANSFDAYEAFWTYVQQRTLAVRRRLPRTALAIHGAIGLREREALDAHMRALVATIVDAGEEFTFWLPSDER